MNKNLILAALAAVAVGCNNDDVLVDNQKDANVPIAFTTFADKATRGSTKPDGTEFVLESFHQTFAVYGTKKSKVDGSISYVFGDNATAIAQTNKYNGVTCTYNGDTSTDPTGEWIYSPHRYWDTQADYKFIAYAPAAAPLRYIYTATGAEASASKFLSTTAYTIGGQNLQATAPAAAEVNFGFTGDTGKDCDIMISDLAEADGATHKTSVTEAPVDLIFHHTLAKLNVNLSVAENAPTTTGTAGYKVEVTSVTVEDLFSTGKFDSSSEKKWAVDNSTTGGKVDYTFSATTPGVQLDEDGKYFIESLVMPQEISADQKVTLEYTVTSIDAEGNEYSEVFKYETTLGEIFKIDDSSPIATDFVSNGNYTVSFKINPENNVIMFDAGVAEWATKISSDETIE